MKYDCTIYDRCEGRLRVTVEASNEDEADEEAGVYAAEMGYNHVEEIVIGVFE